MDATYLIFIVTSAYSVIYTHVRMYNKLWKTVNVEILSEMSGILFQNVTFLWRTLYFHLRKENFLRYYASNNSDHNYMIKTSHSWNYHPPPLRSHFSPSTKFVSNLATFQILRVIIAFPDPRSRFLKTYFPTE